MSRVVLAYLTCDAPGCAASTFGRTQLLKPGDEIDWAEKVLRAAREGGWTDRDAGTHYCADHSDTGAAGRAFVDFGVRGLAIPGLPYASHRAACMGAFRSSEGVAGVFWCCLEAGHAGPHFAGLGHGIYRGCWGP